MRGLLSCRSHVRFSTLQGSRSVLECVVEWGGGGIGCCDAVRDALQKNHWWPTGWSEDGDGIKFTAHHVAVRKQTTFIVPGGMSDIQAVIDRFPNRHSTPSRVSFAECDSVVFQGRSKPLDYWLNKGVDDEPVRYPFGTPVPIPIEPTSGEEKRKPRRRTRKYTKNAQQRIREHWKEVKNSGNEELIGFYLTGAETEVANIFGVARNTLRKSDFFANRDTEAREWRRRNCKPSGHISQR